MKLSLIRIVAVIGVTVALAVAFSSNQPSLQKTQAQAYNEACLTHLYTGCPLIGGNQ